MDWSELADKVRTVAPDLAVDLVTGNYVGMARTAVAGFMGAPEPTPDAIAQAMDADPDLALRLRELDINRYKAETARQELWYAEQDSARAMNIAAMNNGRGETQERLAYGLIIAGFTLVAAVLFVPGPYIDDQMRTWAFPFAQSIISMVVGFYFGSTQWANRNTMPASPQQQQRNFMGSVKTGKRQ